MPEKIVKKIIIHKNFDENNLQKELRFYFYADGSVRFEFVSPKEGVDPFSESNPNSVSIFLSKEIVNLLTDELLEARQARLF